MKTTQEIKSYPKDHQVFSLTLNLDAPENRPLAIIADRDLSGWAHLGQEEHGIQTHNFILIPVTGPLANSTMLLLAATKAVPGCHLPGGVWLKAFAAEYPDHDGLGPIGVADLMWMDREGIFYSPIISQEGRLIVVEEAELIQLASMRLLLQK